MKNLLLQRLQAGAPRISAFGKVALATVLTSLALAEPAAAQTATAGRVVWPLRRNNQDSTAARSAGLAGAATTFRGLVISNGSATTGTIAPAYASRGQAFAPMADGSGWPGSQGGPGASPTRTYYQQFVVTASAATRLDSLLFTTVIGSSANGRVGLQYSRSGFVSDSANFTGGKGPAYAGFTSGTTTYPASNGGVLPATADGSFPATGASTTTGAIIPQLVTATGNTGTFRFALNGATGLTLSAGQTLTVRLYFAVNSGSAGRYALLRDVTLFGRAGGLATAAARATYPLTAYPNPVQSRLDIEHPAAPQGARLTVYSATGQRVLDAAVQPGAQRTSLEMNKLPGGIYLAEYADAHQRITTSVVKQ